MQDKGKIKNIQNLLNGLIEVNNHYFDENLGIYFNYDTVIELLQKTAETIDCTVRCPRPNNVTMDIPWCESMNVEFDPFVYKGDMSSEDFIKAQNHYFDDKEDENEEYEI